MLKENKYRYNSSSIRRANRPIPLVFKPAITVCVHDSVICVCSSPADILGAGGK